jgi:hypothetical protein
LRRLGQITSNVKTDLAPAPMDGSEQRQEREAEETGVPDSI